jgi:hypothetical protein
LINCAGPVNPFKIIRKSAFKINIENLRCVCMCKDPEVSEVDCTGPPTNPQVEVEGWTDGMGILPASQRARLRRGVSARLGLRRRWATWPSGYTTSRAAARALVAEVRRAPVRRLVGSEPLVRCRQWSYPLRGRCVGCEACPLAG